MGTEQTYEEIFSSAFVTLPSAQACIDAHTHTHTHS